VRSVVIVGGGQAGVQVADTLRSEGFDGAVALVAEEPGDPYQRPQLSKEYLSDPGVPQPLALRTLETLQARGISVHAEIAARALDLESRVVELADGRTIVYDELVLATGSRNRELPVPGVDLAGVHALRTLPEALALRDALPRARRLVVVGAGFIGLEIASAARRHGADVTVLDVADRPMARVLTPEMSAFFAHAHERDGVALVLGEGVAGFEGDDHVRVVVGSSGARYEADLVVVGVGASAHARLAEDAGLLVADGIVTDECLRASASGVWAAGDCARFERQGSLLRLESVQNAVDQGKHVARSILAGPRPYRDVPWFWSHQCGVRLQIAGIIGEPDEVVIRGSRDEGRFSAFSFRRGELLGVESVNSPADHVSARRLLAGGATLTPAQAADSDLDLKALSRALQPSA